MVGLVNDGTDEGMRGEYGIDKIAVRGGYGTDNIAGREPRSAMGDVHVAHGGGWIRGPHRPRTRKRNIGFVAPKGPRTRYRFRGP